MLTTGHTLTPGRATSEAGAFALRVRAYQVRLILAHTRVATVAATVFAGALTAQLYYEPAWAVSPVFVAGWLATKVGVSATRMLCEGLLRRRLARGLPGESGLVSLLTVDGFVWGVGGAGLMYGPSDTWALGAASMCGISFIATLGLQISAKATSAYIVPILLPVSLVLISRADQRGIAAGLGLVIFLGLMLSTSLRSERRLVEMLEHQEAAENASTELAVALESATLHSEEKDTALALAQRLSAAKDRFLAVVSHELRTPLHGILGLARMTRLEMKNLNPHVDYRLTLIHDAAVHLQRLVNDILDISSIEDGRLQLEPSAFNIVYSIETIAATYKTRADEVGVRFTKMIDDSLGRMAWGDEARVSQILHNLLDNALKFVPLGGSVRMVVRRPHFDSLLQVEVTDDGPGVRAEDLESIFDPFVQSSSLTGSRPQGIGLGLAISRELARSMNGDLTCASTLGEGSTFKFVAVLPVLPQRDSEAVASAGPSPVVDPSIEATSISENKTFLVPDSFYVTGLHLFVADDDAVSSMLCASVGARLGLNYLEFKNGRDIVTAATGPERPEVVIMDWDLPELNGLEATLQIREHETLNGLEPMAIIGLSANVSQTYEEAARFAGMDAWLIKPCDPGILMETIRAKLYARARRATKPM